MQKHNYFPRKLQSSCATRTESVLIILGKAIIELLAHDYVRPAARFFSAVVWSASLSFSQGITSQVRYVLKTGLT